MPKDAKYSQSSVQQDKRESKKRKLEDRRRKHVQTQTVTRPKILTDPLIAGIGLSREHDARKRSSFLSNRDAALVRELVPAARKVEIDFSPRRKFEIANIEPCPHTLGDIVALHAARGDSSTRSLHWAMPRAEDHQSHAMLRIPRDDLSGPYAAFGSPVTSISVAAQNDDVIVFAAAEQKASPGNVFSGRLLLSNLDNGSPQLATSNFATLGATTSTSLWQTSINPTAADTVAVAGTLGVWSLDFACTLKDRLSITRRDYAEPEDDETRAVDWLDAHTIAAGNEHVYLWDQRSRGASQRFRCPGRVTGIQNPERGILRPPNDNGGGQTLLITTNHTINLFDVRYASKSQPVLSWTHEHEGLQIEMTSSGQGLFAAGDRDGYVHVYSTGTGREVRRLAKAEGWRGKGPVGNLRWVEDGDGRVGVRALQGGEVVEWRWSGEE